MYTCDLPSGSKVSVEAPEFSHRMEALKEFRTVESQKEVVGYNLEELMAAKSIVAVNGNPVNTGFAVSPIYTLAGWPNVDVQYYIEWYMTLFFADEHLKNKAIEAAKKLMIGGPDQTKSKSKTAPAKV